MLSTESVSATSRVRPFRSPFGRSRCQQAAAMPKAA